MAVTGSARRSFDSERQTFLIPGGGMLDIGISGDGDVKLTFTERKYKLESMFRGGEASTTPQTLVLVPDPARPQRARRRR
jgi:hypothetical protein